jgi:hypothetical protein
MQAPSRRAGVIVLAVAILSGCGTEGGGRSALPPFAAEYSTWGAPASAESLPGTSSELNTAFLDGCPILSPDGLSLYLASNRPNGVGGIDIWVAARKRVDAGWEAPKNLGAPINSVADDFCPTPTEDGLYFVSARSGGCGGPDIYFARRNADGGWLEAENLGCSADGGPNSAGGEASPSYVVENGRPVLYFSSNRPAGANDTSVPDSDIYVSARGPDGKFMAARPVRGLNTAGDDSRPNVRTDGLEIFFDRSAKIGGPADIYTAKRAGTREAWSDPVKLDAPVNTAANEARASLSADGRTLTFGSNRAGSERDPATGLPSMGIYFTTRTSTESR